MPNEKTDHKGFASNEPDKERDMAAKGGPSTSLGNADDKHGISSPYDEDLQTQITVKGKGHKKQSERREDEKTERKSD
jgi:hypothetical protein